MFEVQGVNAWDRVGASVASGDWNGDGHDDLAADDALGNVYLLFRSP